MVKSETCLYSPSMLWAAATFDTSHSFGTRTLGIFGSSGPFGASADVVAAALVRVGIDKAVGGGAGSFAVLKRLERSVEGVESLENRFVASFEFCCATGSFSFGVSLRSVD